MKNYFSTTIQRYNVNDFFYLVCYSFILASMLKSFKKSTYLVNKPTSKENTVISLRIIPLKNQIQFTQNGETRK